jgi:signal transduction histidine kinase
VEKHTVKARFWKRWFVSGSLVVSVLVGLMIVALVRRHHLWGLPYNDSFARGNADEWHAFGGTWRLSDGTMRNDSDERGAKLLAGSLNWQNYALEADIELLGHDGDAGLIIRSSDEEEGVDSYNGYYAGLRNRDNSLILGRANHGWLGEQTALVPGGVHAFRWYHIKLIAVGCELVASAIDTESGVIVSQRMTEADCTSVGRIGLRSYSSGGIWRNVRAIPASSADLRSMQGSIVATAVSSTGSFLERSGSEKDKGPEEFPGTSISQSISGLRLLPNSTSQLVTVRGVVVLTTPTLYVQDSSGGVAVPTPQGPPLKVGDEVEVTGEPEPGDFSSVLRHARIQLLWAREPIPPVSVTASQAASGAFDATFVELEGRLVKIEKPKENTVVLDLQAGQQSFSAVVNGARGDAFLRRLKENSLLRMRGVCVVDSEFTHNLTPFVLLMPSMDEVDVLAGPPWWTAGHLVAIVMTLLVLVLLAQVVQSRAEHWRLRAVLDERERLAHEMHDTIAQSFAGIGFQLQAIRNNLADQVSPVRRQLDLACDLVRHSHEEARRSIATLRPESIDSVGLVTALDSCARRMVDGGAVHLNVSVAGDVRTIPIRISDTLFRIGQEAIANAVRHARPSKVNIVLRYEASSVRLVVEDDGVGFVDRGDSLGFGVRGMRRRAEAISAAFNIVSSREGGTRVQVTAGLPPKFTMKEWHLHIWNYLREFRSNGQHSRHTNSHSYRG